MEIDILMDNLKKEMWEKIKENDYTLKEYAIICDISYQNLRRILGECGKDITVSTLLNICENSKIELEDILGINHFDFKKLQILVKYDGKIIFHNKKI